MGIYRIMPTTVTPERPSVTRREREGKDRRGTPQREPADGDRNAGPSSPPTSEDRTEAQVAEEQGKGRRLNVSA